MPLGSMYATGRAKMEAYGGDDYYAFDQNPANAGGIFKTAAIEVLKQEKRMMSTGDITKVALERKLVKCQGKTPENTMASALYTDVRKRGRNSVFIKCVRHRPKEGLFGLRTWLNEPWLGEWLAKEGIQLGDDPSFAEPSSPPVKRHKGASGGYTRRGRQHQEESEQEEEPEETEASDQEEGEEDVSGTGEEENDSDEKSNLALLLEAADEINRNDDEEDRRRVPKPNRRYMDDEPPKPARASKPPKPKHKGRSSKSSRDQFPMMDPAMGPGMPYYPFYPGFDPMAPPMPPGMMPPYGGFPPYPMHPMFNPMMAMGMGMGYPMGPLGMEAGQGAPDSEGNPPDAEAKAKKGLKEGDQEAGGEGEAAATGRQSATGIDAAGEDGAAAGEQTPPADGAATGSQGGEGGAGAAGPSRAGSVDGTMQLPGAAAGQSPTACSMGTTSLPSMADLLAPGKTPRSGQILPREHAAGMLGGLMMPSPSAEAGLDSDKINMYRQHILFLERVLGSMHPQVGKAYVFLARVLQHEGSRWSLTMAQRALLRAWQILAQMKTRLDPEAPSSLGDFSYLMGHLQDSQNQHNIAAGMPPAPPGAGLASAQQKLAASYIAAAGFGPAGFGPAPGPMHAAA